MKTSPKRRKPASKTSRPERRYPPVLPPGMQKQTRMRYGIHGLEESQLGYRAAEVARTSGRPPASGGSGDFHLDCDLPTLRAESQRFDRDNGLYRGLINRCLDNVLGNGFTLKPETGDARKDEVLKTAWKEWAKTPEVRGMDDWTAVERMALRQLLVDGDFGNIKLREERQIQMIEGERLTRRSAHELHDAVVVDTKGRPTAFYVADYDQHGQVRPNNNQPVKADDFIFVAYRDRISQTRGFPCQVSNFPMFHRIADVCDSEAIAWQILSRVALIVQMRNAGEFSDVTSQEDASKRLPPDVANRYHTFGEGSVFWGEPGEEIKAIERNIPGANFPASITMYLRLLGLPLGMPLELVLLDWSKTNYSSARAALEQAYRMFSTWQALLIRCFHSRVYEWKVRHFIADGLLRNTPEAFKHSWIAPRFPWIDMLKEAQANGMAVDRGFTTYTRVAASNNLDRTTLLDEREKEIQEAIDRAKKLNDKNPGANVPWQMFAGTVNSNKPDPVEKPTTKAGPGAKKKRAAA